MYLAGLSWDVLHLFRVCRNGVVIMSTYEEFMIILAVARLIISILNLEKKIAVLFFGENDSYFLTYTFRRVRWLALTFL